MTGRAATETGSAPLSFEEKAIRGCMFIRTVLVDLLCPPRCAFCGNILPVGGGGICGDCAKNLPYTQPGKVLRKVGNHTCAVTFYYEDMVRTGIHALKFQRKCTRAKAFAPYLVRTIAEELGGEFDAVTYVPISFQRRFRRGFDQTRLLARHVAGAWDVKIEKTLRKIRNNPPQSSVKTARARRENVQNVFRTVPEAAIAGRRFLLIDESRCGRCGLRRACGRTSGQTVKFRFFFAAEN